jgi:hypothetical protein
MTTRWVDGDKKSWVGVLHEARGLLERGWTVKAFARDAAGTHVESLNPDATCWCAAGAISKATNQRGDYHIWEALEDEFLDGESISKFNDNQHTVEPVLELFARAIAKWETET